jgi:endonuclease III
VRSIARRVQVEFGGNLRGALARLPAGDAHRLLRTFPGIGTPGADRMLLFGELAPVAAVPSNCPHVLTRIESATVPTPYTAAYAQARRSLETLPATFDARRRAYLLLRIHGQELCKTKNPRCGDCPVAARCAFVARRTRRRRTGAAAR